MNFMFTVFFIFGIIIFIGVFIYVMLMMFGVKTRSKMISRQIKSISGATNMSKEDIESVLTNLSDATIKSKKRILEENEEDLKDIKDAEMRINKDAIKETAKSIKEGLVGEMYCKHCGKSIDRDSKYCKYCGQEL